MTILDVYGSATAAAEVVKNGAPQQSHDY